MVERCIPNRRPGRFPRGPSYFPALVLGSAAILALTLAPIISQAADDKASKPNPYLAPSDRTPQELQAFLQRMKEKPRTIRHRPGFGEAMIDAAERFLAGNPPQESQPVGILGKFEGLSLLSDRGEAAARDRLAKYAEELLADSRPEVALEARFHQLDLRLQNSKIPPAEIPTLLAELKEFFKKQPPNGRHERLASATVRLINALKNDDQAAQAYQDFGEIFKKSSDKKLARYGKDLDEYGKELLVFTKPIEFEGPTADDQIFKLASYRGKYVLIDFWATWCGPCVARMPDMKEIHGTYRERGFEIVGVSLDNDKTELLEFIRENEIKWVNLFQPPAGEKMSGHPLAERFNVTAIPSLFLLDQSGKVMARDLTKESLAAELAKLLPAKK